MKIPEQETTTFYYTTRYIESFEKELLERVISDFKTTDEIGFVEGAVVFMEHEKINEIFDLTDFTTRYRFHYYTLSLEPPQ